MITLVTTPPKAYPDDSSPCSATTTLGGVVTKVIISRKEAKEQGLTRYFTGKACPQKHTSEILGCSWQELKEYIESKFVDGMNWENRHLWHIDHKIPLATAKTEKGVYKLCHYTNLQPLWAEDNLRKGSKLIEALL